MRILALDHLVLTVADPEATIAFYEALGMTCEVFDDDRLALRFGRQKINLHRAGAEQLPGSRRVTPGSGDLCFLVDGAIAEVERELTARGIPIEVGPVDQTGAVGPMRSVYVRDPDGNLVELSEPCSSHPS